jgi:hypothetical protein
MEKDAIEQGLQFRTKYEKLILHHQKSRETCSGFKVLVKDTDQFRGSYTWSMLEN